MRPHHQNIHTQIHPTTPVLIFGLQVFMRANHGPTRTLSVY